MQVDGLIRHAQRLGIAQLDQFSRFRQDVIISRSDLSSVTSIAFYKGCATSSAANS